MSFSSQADINAQSSDGLPIIFQRIEERDVESVEALLDAGLDIEVRGFAGSSPALWAANGNVWVICLALLERGADPRTYDRAGFTIPYLAEVSPVKLNSEQGRALTRVRGILADAGLMNPVYTPRDVKDLITAGDWPPSSW